MRWRIRLVWLRAAVPALVCALATSCSSLIDSLAHDDRPVPNDVELVPVVRAALAPALIQHVDSSGLFRFPTPNVGVDELPLDSALVQAHEFLFYVLNIVVFRAAAEDQRGAFIDLGKLTRCNRAQLVRSVFERPTASISVSLQVQLASRWLIPFCGEYEGPEVITSVATLANHVRFQGGRPVSDSANYRFAFQMRGIRWEWKTEHMLTAEEAVNEIYAASGARAVRLPEIAYAEQVNGRNSNNSGICPVWRVALEQAVRVSTDFSHRTASVSELYVADSDCPGVIGHPMLMVPWFEQPATREVRATHADPSAATGFRTESFVATYRGPVNFESAVVVR